MKSNRKKPSIRSRTAQLACLLAGYKSSTSTSSSTESCCPRFHNDTEMLMDDDDDHHQNHYRQQSEEEGGAESASPGLMPSDSGSSTTAATWADLNSAWHDLELEDQPVVASSNRSPGSLSGWSSLPSSAPHSPVGAYNNFHGYASAPHSPVGAYNNLHGYASSSNSVRTSYSLPTTPTRSRSRPLTSPIPRRSPRRQSFSRTLLAASSPTPLLALRHLLVLQLRSCL
jgi:hypothetical protein